MPAASAALFVGAALAVAGVLIQGIVRNPLASPDILGVNHAASLASVGALLLMPSLPVMVLPLLAFAGGMAGLILLKMLAKTHQPMKLALTGVALSACWASLTDYLMLSRPQDVNNALLWLTGSLWGRDWSFVKIAIPLMILFLPLSLSFCRDLDLLALGVVGSINSLVRNLGQVIGITISTTLLYNFMSIKAGYRVNDYVINNDKIFVFGMRNVYIIVTLVCLIGAILIGFYLFKYNKNEQ